MANLDKSKVVSAILEKLRHDLDGMLRAAHAAHDAAINEESRAEDEHDTRGLEASYLAGAQAERAAQIQETLHFFETVSLRTYGRGDRIDLGALVSWKAESRPKATHGLLLSQGAGTTVTVDGISIQVISPVSPVGEALMGLRLGDSFELEIGKEPVDLEVVGVS